MDRQSKILILGAGGLIGRRIAAQLQERGYINVTACCHSDLDLLDQTAVARFVQNLCPDYVFFCAVKTITDFSAGQVGDAEELEENLLMTVNTMRSCRSCGVKRMIFLGSAMLYPWNIEPEPERYTEEMIERFNLKGYSKSMEAAVLSKLLTYKLCCYNRRQYGSDILYCLPVHIYGGFAGRRNFYLIERLVMEICEAKLHDVPDLRLDIYGQGIARKGFLHVDDCASALISVMSDYRGNRVAINIAPEETTCWSEIVRMICKITDYRGRIEFETDKPENLVARISDSSILSSLGWKQRYTMEQGLKALCQEYFEWKDIHPGQTLL